MSRQADGWRSAAEPDRRAGRLDPLASLRLADARLRLTSGRQSAAPLARDAKRSALTARRITRIAGLACARWTGRTFLDPRTLADSDIAMTGSSAGSTAARVRRLAVAVPPSGWLSAVVVRIRAPTAGQRIPSRRSSASLPRCLGESAADERQSSRARRLYR